MRNCRPPKPVVLASVSVVLALLFVLACGTAAPPTTTPPAPVTPTTAPAATPTVTAAPTVAAQAAPIPEGDEMAGPEYAPSFAEYWKPPTEYYGQPVYGGTLRINFEDPLEHANIWGATGAASKLRIPVMDTLFQKDPYDYWAEFIPSLAYGWTIHDDHQGITFHLRDDVKWHNGADFTCEDARFSFERMISGEGLTASYMKAKLVEVATDHPTCLDDSTLEFRFNTPSATPLLIISHPHAMIFNKEWFQAGGEDAMFLDMSVGTGPFTWAEGQSIGEADRQRYVKNPGYFVPELPYVDELVIFGIQDESAQQAAMLAHQTDWHWVRNWGQYQAYVDHEQIVTAIRATNSHPMLWLNKRNTAFDNVRVRQAIAMGIDRQAAIAALQAGFGTHSPVFPMPPGSAWELEHEVGCEVPGWCHPEDMEAQRAEARQILEEEGFKFDKTYLFTVESDAQVVARATFLQEQLRLLGIQTDFDMVEFIAVRKMWTDGTWGDLMAYNGGIPTPNPYDAMRHFARCDSLYNFWTPGTECDPEMEQLLDQLGGSLDPEERKRLSDEVQLHIMNQYWYIPVYWEQEATAWWPEVRGFAHSSPEATDSFRRFFHMWIDPAHKDDKGNRGQTSGPPGGL